MRVGEVKLKESKSEEAGTTEEAVEARQSPVQTAGRSPEAFLWKMLSC